MSDWIKVARASDIPDPGKETLEVADTMVVLVHAGGAFHCIDDVCTHDGGPLGDGPLDGCQIICPRHGARFDVRTGKALTMPATVNVQAHEVKVEGDDVFVRLNENGG
ncbi:MAG: non-heme iron oxygenase ferredoxin subunit [Planctomycetes bacterium]|nr:non-heme iron oxygenase ferredoxin subunit [Planctomycetota bacterium]